MRKHKKAFGGCLCVHVVLAGEDDEADGDERVALNATTSASLFVAVMLSVEKLSGCKSLGASLSHVTSLIICLEVVRFCLIVFFEDKHSLNS
jgi:hypothetical protein